MPNINTSNPLGAVNTAIAKELSQLREKTPIGKNASVFRIYTKPDGSVDPASLQKLIETARGSKAYQRNKEKYQFTLVDRKGERAYLALKRQGLWSKFKSLFPSTQAERQKRREDASKIVLDSLSKIDVVRWKIDKYMVKPSDEENASDEKTPPPQQVKTLAEARGFQRDVMATKFVDVPQEPEVRKMSDLLASEARMSEQLLPASDGQQHRSDLPVSDALVGSPKEPDYLKGAPDDPYNKKFRDNSIYEKPNKSVVSEQGFVNKDYEDDGSEDEGEKYEVTGNQLKFFEQFVLSQLKTDIDYMTKNDD